jgi:periplasmic mercuric ion binding protein
MKKILQLLIPFFLTCHLFAQDAKLHLRDFTPSYTVTSFKVPGTCGLCTMRILNAVKVDGVKSAFWDQESQELTVQYNNRKIPLQKIYQVVSAAGHDTEAFLAANAVYASLPACCHYNRKLLKVQKN